MAFAEQVSNRAYKAELGPPMPTRWQMRNQPPLKRLLPYPATNEIAKAIHSWLRFCSSLGIPPGAQTNLAAVFWARTFSYTNHDVSRVAPVAQIAFTNGTRFEAINGVAFSHYAEDAMYSGFWQEMTPEERDTFKGKINKDWKELARDLERTLIRSVGIPESLLTPYSFTVSLGTPREIGAVGIKRLVLDWRNWPRNAGREVSVDETRSAFAAEFDLETGELKWINFHDPNFIAALRVAQAKEIK